MSDVVDTEVNEEAEAEVKTEFKVEIMISDSNLSYKSDFAEGDTVFWLEAVKNLIIKNTFENGNLSQAS